MRGSRINRPATDKIQAAGYQTLEVYKDIYGWKVWDKTLSNRQFWNGYKRLPNECVKEVVKKGNVPHEP